MKVIIAMFKTQYGEHPIACREDGTCWADDESSYLRISENIEVEFVAVQPSLETQLSKLEKQEREAIAAHNARMDTIAKERAALLDDGALAAEQA